MYILFLFKTIYKLYLLQIYILKFVKNNNICLEDEYYNSLLNKCIRCTEELIGCFSCELNQEFQCKKCLNGYSPTYNSEIDKIVSCQSNCEYPFTFSSIPNKNLKDECQINLWNNEHNSYNKYDSNLVISNPRETSTEELEALKLFYKETNGPFWINNNNWLLDDPCLNKWYGVHCNLRGNIIGLIFHENYIQGIISSEVINGLIHLEKIIIINTLKYTNETNENIIYFISPNIWNIKKLNEVIIKNVKLYQSTATLFPETDKNIISNVEIIELDYNKIYSKLPDFSRFEKLKILSMSNNNIIGDLSNLNTIISDMEIIQINDNNLEGEIPNLNNLQINKKLQVLDLRNNSKLNGDLPNNFFSEEYFPNLKYIGLILTHVTPPPNCKNHAICIKRLLQKSKSIHDEDFELTSYEINFLLPRPNI